MSQSLFTQPRYTLTFVIVTFLWAAPDVIDSIWRRPKGNTLIVRERGSHWFIRIGLTMALFAAILLAAIFPALTMACHLYLRAQQHVPYVQQR